MADVRSRSLGGGMATWMHAVYVCSCGLADMEPGMRPRDGSMSTVEAENHD